MKIFFGMNGVGMNLLYFYENVDVVGVSDIVVCIVCYCINNVFFFMSFCELLCVVSFLFKGFFIYSL